MEITKDMTLRQIATLSEFAPMRGKFIASTMGDQMKEKYELTLLQLEEKHPTWNPMDILYGLNRLFAVAKSGKQYVFELPNGISLIRMPAANKKHDAFAILMAGGAYGAVCTMVEALPVAAKLNELGMDCFCLNYRTVTAVDFLKGLMPKPMDDVAAAWRFIKENESFFGVDAENYIAAGFSAGGHLASMWGTAHKGAKSYGIANPQMLLLAYPLITVEFIEGPAAKMIATGMFGAAHGAEKVLQYAAHRHVDEDYPPVYLVQAENDDTVPIAQAGIMEAALLEAGVRYRMDRAASGGHGFGLGSATPADGWVERALHFLEGE